MVEFYRAGGIQRGGLFFFFDEVRIPWGRDFLSFRGGNLWWLFNITRYNYVERRDVFLLLLLSIDRLISFNDYFISHLRSGSI